MDVICGIQHYTTPLVSCNLINLMIIEIFITIIAYASCLELYNLRINLSSGSNSNAIMQLIEAINLKIMFLILTKN